MNKFKNRLIFRNKTNFKNLERIVKISLSVICSEFVASHTSNSFNIKTIFLINKISLKRAILWNKYMKNLNFIYRGNLNSVCKQISNVKL